MLLLAAPAFAAAQQGSAADDSGINGPAPPVPPAVVSRDAEGRATVRAVRIREDIRIDGRLDEAAYQNIPPVGDFIQQIPKEGAPASEPTEAWILFDDANIYVSARCYDSTPESEWVANELRRDTSQLRQNDTFGVMFDTFYDRRNGVMFYTNPLGAYADFAITNEGNPNSDWNTIWDVRTGRFEGGWTVEMRIPFKSLRYRPGATQIWGVQLRRVIRHKNEAAYLTRLPISAAGGGGGGGVTAGSFRVSAAGTLVGLEVPQGGRTLEVKPYLIGGLTTDRLAAPPTSNDGSGDVGGDVKIGITQNLTADFTVNTDFAQVEVDEQQVNLTRFSLFFPEKREFFLEGRGIFDFARGGPFSGGFGGGDVPTLFFSRRIGLLGSSVIPITAGGRVTGKVGPFDVGALNIRTGADDLAGAEATNFTVVRVKRDILSRSSVGAIFTNRSESLVGDGSNQVYGADATFAFFENVSLVSYLAKTSTPGRRGDDLSYQGKFGYDADRYGLTVDHLVVEDNFIPEVGFVRRDNIRRTFGSARFSPRPRSIDAVRRFSLESSLDYIVTANGGLLETREGQASFSTEFENSDQLVVSATDTYELLTRPFQISDNVVLPVGGYNFTAGQVGYRLGQQRRVSGEVAFSGGEFWGGTIRTLSFGAGGASGGRVELTPQLSLEPSFSLNWIDLPQGEFTTELVRTRLTYTFTPRMFFSGLLQYNSSGDTFGTNLRLRWEYSPGSELFVVYTEDLDTAPLGPDRSRELRNRGLVIKLTRLFRL